MRERRSALTHRLRRERLAARLAVNIGAVFGVCVRKTLKFAKKVQSVPDRPAGKLGAEISSLFFAAPSGSPFHNRAVQLAVERH